MTNTPTPAPPPAPAEIDDAAQYRVTMKNSVTIGVTHLNRGSHIVLTGLVLKQVLADVESYTRQ
jgi:hypothetical protein